MGIHANQRNTKGANFGNIAFANPAPYGVRNGVSITRFCPPFKPTSALPSGTKASSTANDVKERFPKHLANGMQTPLLPYSSKY